MDYMNIPIEKFALANEDSRIKDKKFATKPVGYFRDALRRFRKNKSSVAAAVIILFLFLYAFIVPFVSHYDVTFRDGYYKMVLPKSETFAFLGWDGCGEQTETQAGYDYYNSIGQEYGSSSVREVRSHYSENGNDFYKLYVDSYEKVGFVYADLSKEDYFALQEY